MTYTLQERVEIISLFFRSNDCARAAALSYNELHLNAHLSHTYVLQLVAKFRETGSVLNKKRIVENPVRNEAIEVAVLGHIAIDPTLSTRKVSDVTGVSRRTIQRTLKTHKFHPYKIKLVHELNEDDDDRRLQFCELISEMIICDPQFIFNITIEEKILKFRPFVNRNVVLTMSIFRKCHRRRWGKKASNFCLRCL